MKPDADEFSEIVAEVFLMGKFWLFCIIPSVLLGMFNTWILWDIDKYIALLIGSIVSVIAILIGGVFGLYCGYIDSLKRDTRNMEKFMAQLFLYSASFRKFIAGWMKEIR